MSSFLSPSIFPLQKNSPKLNHLNPPFVPGKQLYVTLQNLSTFAIVWWCLEGLTTEEINKYPSSLSQSNMA